MYIRGLISRNFAEFAEAVPVPGRVVYKCSAKPERPIFHILETPRIILYIIYNLSFSRKKRDEKKIIRVVLHRQTGNHSIPSDHNT